MYRLVLALAGNKEMKTQMSQMEVPIDEVARVVKAACDAKYVTATLAAPGGKSVKLLAIADRICRRRPGQAARRRLEAGGGSVDIFELQQQLLGLGRLAGKAIELTKTGLTVAVKGNSFIATAELTLRDLAADPATNPAKDAKVAKSPLEKDRPAFKQLPLQSALIPEGPLPENLGSSTREKQSEKSVVFIKVTDKDGVVSEGSGFIARSFA